MNLLIAFQHVTLIDGTGGDPVPDATVALRDGQIIYAGTSRTWLPSIQEDILNLDFTGKFLLPGLIDCHVNLARSGEPHGRIEGDDAALTLRMLTNARRNLAAGFTTVCDFGGWNEVEFSVRDAIQRGDFCGPRLLLTGRCLTGSQAAAAQYPGSRRLVQGPEETRKAAREGLHRGADALELSMTGDMLVLQDLPVAKQLSTDEVSAAVDEAHKAGRRIAAAAHGLDGIRQAVLAGADSIEHGTYLHKGRDVMDEMKKRGTFLVPALGAGRVLAEGATGRVPGWMVERMNEMYEAAKKAVRLAYQAGIPIAMGSNAGTPLNRHGENALEVLGLTGIGMKPMDALVASTLTAASALALGDRIGSIQEGKLADLLVMDSDPMEDLGRLADHKQIRAVFLGGKLVARQPTDAYPKNILARDGLLIA